MGALCLFRTSAPWECGVSRKVPVSKYRQGGIPQPGQLVGRLAQASGWASGRWRASFVAMRVPGAPAACPPPPIRPTSDCPTRQTAKPPHHHTPRYCPPNLPRHSTIPQRYPDPRVHPTTPPRCLWHDQNTVSPGPPLLVTLLATCFLLQWTSARPPSLTNTLRSDRGIK
jgi:hypothetical protein